MQKKVYRIINLQEVCSLLQAHFQTNNKITCFMFKDKLNALNGPLLEHLYLNSKSIQYIQEM
jgi:hypothetical protein